MLGLVMAALLARSVLGAGEAEAVEPGVADSSAMSGAPPGLSAFDLLAGVDAEATLGKPFVAVEDLGVFPYGCALGLARALTARGAIVEAQLQTLPSQEDAASEFETSASWAGSEPEDLEAGERGVYAFGNAIILSGEQVLVLRSFPSPKTDLKLARKAERQKSQGKDVSKLWDPIYEEVRSLAPLMGTGMTGTCPGDAILALPAGSVDPCLVDPVALPAGTSLEGLAGTNVMSTSPPWLECTYRNMDSGPITVATLSPSQLAASIDGLTAAGTLRDIPEGTLGRWDEFNEGAISGVVQTAPGFDGPGLDVVIAVSGGDPSAAALLRIRQSSTGTLMDPSACAPFLGAVVEGFVSAAVPSRPAETDAVLDRLVTTCSEVTAG
jgi:hypothetical protein